MTQTAESVPVRPPTPPPLTGRAAWTLLAAVLGVSVAVFGLLAVVVLWVPGGREHGLTLLALSLPLHALVVLATLHSGLRRAGTGWRALGFERPTARLLHLLWQVPCLVVVVLLVQVLVAVVLGLEPPAEDDGIDQLAPDVGPVTVLALLVGVVVLAPIWEEAVFRGVVQGGLRRRWPVWAAVPVAAACFAATHGIPLLLAYLFTMGIGLGVLREVHRTLWASVLAHGTVNALASGALLSALLG